MTRNELIAAVADKTGMSRLESAAAIEAAFEILVATLQNGEEVKIVGFGSFRVVEQPAFQGRDPRTGTPLAIKASRRPR
jgi:DNA-binding protein HU-beta